MDCDPGAVFLLWMTPRNNTYMTMKEKQEWRVLFVFIRIRWNDSLRKMMDEVPDEMTRMEIKKADGPNGQSAVKKESLSRQQGRVFV